VAGTVPAAFLGHRGSDEMGWAAASASFITRAAAGLDDAASKVGNTVN